MLSKTRQPARSVKLSVIYTVVCAIRYDRYDTIR